MGDDVALDADAVRAQVREQYRQVAVAPYAVYRFHTGRALAARLGYDSGTLAGLPDAAVESFTGIANPFSLRGLEPGERVVDVGSGGGLDSFIAAQQVGPHGHVVGVDMLERLTGWRAAPGGLAGDVRGGGFHRRPHR